jgi:Cu-Zn family superoxide dismutase
MFKLRNFVLIAAFAAVALFVGCSSDDDDDSPAPSVVSQIHLVNAGGVGAEIGTVKAMDTSYGLLFEVEVEAAALSAGYHGFHLHMYPSCEATAAVDGTVTPGGASGGHYIGDGGSSHEGPYGEGHKGDLPQLYATAGGVISNAVVAPRLQLSDIIGRAFIIHAGADDYGSGSTLGARVACGTIGVAETIETTINLVDTTGILAEIGTVTATDSPDGLLLVTNLSNIPAGNHGFHMHLNPDCGTDGSSPASNAGGHYIGNGGPDHGAPDGEGHEGDLPRLTASTGDIVKNSVLAPRLTLNDIRGHSFMIHANDDDYVNQTSAGAKIACGVIGE